MIYPEIIDIKTFVVPALPLSYKLGKYLLKIGKCILKKYGLEVKIDVKMSINAFNKSENNTYIIPKYEEDVYKFCREEIDKMKEDFKNH